MLYFKFTNLYDYYSTNYNDYYYLHLFPHLLNPNFRIQKLDLQIPLQPSHLQLLNRSQPTTLQQLTLDQNMLAIQLILHIFRINPVYPFAAGLIQRRSVLQHPLGSNHRH